jgi:hypothetical protein
MLERAKHPYYKHSDAAFFLVYRQGEDLPVGRLAVWITSLTTNSITKKGFLFIRMRNDSRHLSHC